ncbi:MAG: DEAD/DEAH box helicase [Culicoidibacterales bacterium]
MKYTEMPLSAEMMETLKVMQFDEATPIQQQAIPIALSGKDIIGQAQTGTGKTAAFSIPLIEMLTPEKHVQALILVPTRELAIQVADAISQLSQHNKLRETVVFGGTSIEKQLRELKRGVDIVVATPGRCLDLLKRKALKMDGLKFFVLDEVDEMLNMGFVEDVQAIESKLPKERQTLFFSATMTKQVEKLAKQLADNPERITIEKKPESQTLIEQRYVITNDSRKKTLLADFLRVQRPERAIIFARTKNRVDELTVYLMEQGFFADRIHGDLSQEQRTMAFKKFRAHQTRILIATDVAARGLDIQGVTHVYNFDMPEDLDYYVHRIGRTGRAGLEGMSVSFMGGRQFDRIQRDIEKRTNAKMTKLEYPTVEEVLKAVEEASAVELLNAVQYMETTPYMNLAKKLQETHTATELIAAALAQLAPKFDRDAFMEERENIAKQRNRQHRDRDDRGGRGGGDRRRGDRDRNGGGRGGDRRQSSDNRGGGDRRRGDRDRSSSRSRDFKRSEGGAKRSPRDNARKK